MRVLPDGYVFASQPDGSQPWRPYLHERGVNAVALWGAAELRNLAGPVFIDRPYEAGVLLLDRELASLRAEISKLRARKGGGIRIS